MKTMFRLFLMFSFVLHFVLAGICPLTKWCIPGCHRESTIFSRLAKHINKALEELQQPPAATEPLAAPEEMQHDIHGQKRPLTPLFTKVSPSRSKRQKSKAAHVKDVQARCDECQLDSK